MTHQREGRTGEERARKVPAVAAVHDRLVPGNAAAPGLMRIGDEARRAILRTGRRDQEGIRTLLDLVRPGRRYVGGIRQRSGTLGPQRFVLGERADHRVEAEEERRAQHETRRHVLAVGGEEAIEPRLLWMLFHVAVETRRIGFEERPNVFRLALIIAVDRRADIEQSGCEIGGRPSAAR